MLLNTKVHWLQFIRVLSAVKLSEDSHGPMNTFWAGHGRLFGPLRVTVTLSPVSFNDIFS
jgi:hypothetical protein